MAQRADELVFEVLPAGTSEEKGLALAFKRGDKDAYAAIHERYAARVHSVCRRMLSNPDDAAEAAQETFLRVYQGLARFNGRYRLGAWVVRIATNVCLDQIRARSRRPSDPAPHEIIEYEAGPEQSADPELLFLRNAEGRRVRRVLESLPPMHRAAIVLRDFEGICYAEIAETLGITEGQVKALLHRARRRFRRSWTSSFASLLLPLDAFRRVLRPDTGATQPHLVSATHAAESAVSTSQVVSSAVQAFQACSGALQQCGQFVAEKAAPVVTAMVIGTATVGAAAVVARDDRPDHRERPAAQERQRQEPQGVAAPTDPSVLAQKENKAEAREPQVKANSVDKVVEVQPVAPVEEPVAEEPEPEGSSIVPPAPPPAEEPGAEPEPPEAPPAPPPLPPAPAWNLDFVSSTSSDDLCACSTGSKLLLDQKSGELGKRLSFHQRSQGVIKDAEGDAAWRATFDYFGQVTRRKGSLDLGVFLDTDHGAYRYDAGAAVTDRYPTAEGGTAYSLRGRYALASAAGDTTAMPSKGTLEAVVYFWPDGTIYNVYFSLVEDPAP